MRLISLMAVLACGAGLFAQTAPQPQQTPPKPCSAPEFRQFDFWLGEWNVTAGGKAAGTNSITLAYGGCVIEERWSGAGGMRGGSFNIYDAETGTWHQAWVDNSGGRLAISGKFDGKSMQMSGRHPKKDGSVMIDRITWTPNPDGTVRQLWETSADGGAKWSVAFDGLYTKKK